MSLLLINGSPGGKKGNSRFLLDALRQGVTATSKWETALVDMPGENQVKSTADAARDATRIVIAFPLYVDAMPGTVKSLFEALPPCEPPKERHLGFIVQSGFPESMQSFPLERYLEKLARRLGYRYLGTVIRGGVEVIRMPPPGAGPVAKLVCKVGELTNIGGIGHLLNEDRLQKAFVHLGRSLGESGAFDEKRVKELRALERVNRFSFWLYKTIGERCYWDLLLKRNGARHLKDARPFQSGNS